ncbi:hypothetical protein C8R44DRAFT_862599 [Mycena epipterygia]|nr:hypothetical protein C8R44DRAFT_862599 [Mycena epipterygia]
MTPPSMNIAGTALADFFYGIYFNLFLTSTYLLVRRSQVADAGPLYKSMAFLLGCALFLAVTGHCTIATVRVFQGFIFYEDGTAPAAFFSDKGRGTEQPTEVAGNAFSVTSVLLSDLMVMYRLWVISRRNKLLISLPTLTLIGVTVCGIVLVVDARNAKNIALVISATPLFIFTLTTNFYCTGAIFWKLWTITKDFTPIPGKHSNIRCTTSKRFTSHRSWALVYAVLHQINSPVQYIFFTAMPPLAGIANALIQVRMALGKAIEPPATAASTVPLRFIAGSGASDRYLHSSSPGKMGHKVFRQVHGCEHFGARDVDGELEDAEGHIRKAKRLRLRYQLKMTLE